MKYLVRKSLVECASSKGRRSTHPGASASRALSTAALLSSLLGIMAVPISFMINTLTWDGNHASWPYYVQAGMVASVLLGMVGIAVAVGTMRTRYPTSDWSWVLRLAIVAFAWDLVSIGGLLFLHYALAGWF